MVEIILVGVFAVILLLGYLYFKYRFNTTSFFIFAIGQLVFVTLMFYLKPFRELLLITLVGLSDTDISFLASPPFYIYFLFDVTLITIMYLFVKMEALKTKEFIDTQTNINDLKDSFKDNESSEDRDIEFKITKPEAFKTEDIFYKRVKRIFELTNIVEDELSIDLKNSKEVLYGKIKNLDEYIHIFINCDSTIERVNQNRIDKFIEWIENYSSKNVVKNFKAYYITLNNNIVEKTLKDIAKNSGIKVFKESELLDSLISIDSYLNRLIDKYTNETLPFSIRSEEDKKFSLKDTFVSPSFNREDFKNINENLSLDDFLDKWLSEDSSNRQISILGGYGMGKSSFLLHYATKLAKQYKVDKSARIPIFVPLTNVSPMLDFGLKDRLSNIASDMNIKYETLIYLIEMKKVVLLLDGFDEMGYVGNNEFRLRHFESIWKLATEGNKIIIAGRPSYFFTETELNRALQSVGEDDLIVDDLPHCRLVKLQRLTNKEIKEYLIKYYPKEYLNYFNFLTEQKQLIDLASRPSLMHIIREMLPEIYSNYRENSNDKTLYSAGYLMGRYADHWIKRQTKKGVKGGLNNEDKDNFFQNLAERLYIEKSEVVTPDIIKYFMHEFLPHINLNDKEKADGIQGDILSGSFLQRQITGGYKFVHRSFFEYFVAKKIVNYIKNENSEENEFPKIFFIYWTEEIASFVADLLDKKYNPLPKNLYESRVYKEVRELFMNLAEVEFNENIYNNKLEEIKFNFKILTIKANFFKLSNIYFYDKINKVSLVDDKEKIKIIIRSIFSSLELTSNIIDTLAENIIKFLKSILRKNEKENEKEKNILIEKRLYRYYNFNEVSSENLVKLFKIAIINSINTYFFRKDNIDTFIKDIEFKYFFPQIFIKSGALSKHSFYNWDLNYFDLSKANLKGADLSNTKLKGVNFYKANLNEANLFGIDLIGINLSEANLNKACLIEADLSESNLSKTNLSEANLKSAKLIKTNLKEANLSKTNLNKAKLIGASLESANLKEAYFTGADLYKVNLSKSDLRGVDLTGIDLKDVKLDKAILIGIEDLKRKKL